MSSYRKYYPNLSVIARVYPSHSDSDDTAVVRQVWSTDDSLHTAVVRQVWSTDDSLTERNSCIGGPRFCNREGRRPKRTRFYSNLVHIQHRAKPPGLLGPHGRIQDDRIQDGRIQDGRIQDGRVDGKSSWRGKGQMEGVRRGNRFGAGGEMSGDKCEGGVTWFRMTIPHGKKYDKNWLITALQNHSPIPFRPIRYSIDGHSVNFYLENAAAASALRELSRRITDSEGYKVVIFMNPCLKPPFHQSNLKPEDLEHLKRCMSKRFDGSQMCLDLSSIRTDPDLVSQKIEMTLNRKNCMQAVLRIIEENIPELLCLNLSNNKLFKLTDLVDLVKKTPRLKALNLSHNELRYEQELDKLKGLTLVELWLDWNPLCGQFREKNAYISAVQKRFPKLLKLDGHVLSPPICFVETSTTVPPCKGSYFVSDEIRGVIQNFLQRYYSVYDSGDRQLLLEAYHDGACFSLSMPFVNKTNRLILQAYQEDNRNMKQVKDSSARLHTLKLSKLNVVGFLNKLPKTLHDITSFTVDVNTYTSTLLAFTVSGVFKEVETRSRDFISAFTRVFITVPAPNSGLCVVNDELYVRSVTSLEIRRAFIPQAPTPSSSLVSSLSPSQQHMLSVFSQSSQMNLEWSQKCLQDNDWDFHKAAQIFTELKAQGMIPEAAFIK